MSVRSAWWLVLAATSAFVVAPLPLAYGQADMTPPRIVSIDPAPGTWVVDHVGLAEIRIGFDGPVVIPADAVRVRTARRGAVTDLTTAFDPRRHVLAIGWADPVQADRVTILLDYTITDDAGNALDGEIADPEWARLPSGNGRPAGQAVIRINVLGGDANRDGAVDHADLWLVAAAGGRCAGDPAFDPLTDLNHDGCTGFDDIAVVLQGFGLTLPAGGGVPPSVTGITVGGEAAPDGSLESVRLTFGAPLDPDRFSPRGFFLTDTRGGLHVPDSAALARDGLSATFGFSPPLPRDRRYAINAGEPLASATQASWPPPSKIPAPFEFVSQSKAIYNAGQTGTLPPVVVVRDYTTRDALGNAVAPHEPRWGRPQVRAALQEWALIRPTTQSMPWVISGFDQNGTDPMLCYFRQGPAQIDYWINADLGGGEPTFVQSIAREALLDLLVGTPVERDFYAYTPKGGVALPGCFLFLCERWYNVHEDPELDGWRIEGVSVVAYQRDGGGNFAFEIVGDGPRLNNDHSALDVNRGAPWALSAYFPFTEGQDPLVRAFVPFVDYTNGNSGYGRKGGQVFLFEATRPDPQASWTFGEVYLIDEHVEDGTHFHTAAWTPRGVVAAMGDGVDKNETFLYTCADWGDYTNPFAWTKHERAFGAGTHAEQPARTMANQFGGCAPGRDPNHVLVGADVHGGGVYECAVPGDPGAGLSFTRRWGEFWADDTSGGHVGLWFHKPAPERSTRSLTRVRPQNVSAQEATEAARVLYSDDDLNFMTVARLPLTTHRASYAALYGDDILLFHRPIAGGPQGIWSIPAPVTRGPYRGLCIAGGATNLLALGGDELIGTASGGSNTLTYVGDGLHPETGEPLNAPGFGPVYRIQADASSTEYLSFAPTDEQTVTPGFVYLTFWLRVLGPEGAQLKVELSDAAAPTNLTTWKFKLANREQWVPHTVMLDASSFANDYTPGIRILADGGTPRVADFLIQVEGYHAGERPPYPTVHGTTSPHEQVTQPLGALGDAWTVGLELAVPATAEDWLGHPGAAADGDRVWLATMYGDDDEYAEISADLEADLMIADIYNGGALAGTVVVPYLNVQRGDRLWLALSQSAPSGVTLHAWSGGSTEHGFVSASGQGLALATAPTEVRFGRKDFSLVPTVDVLLVAVDHERALGKDGILTLLSTDFESGRTWAPHLP